MLVVEKPLQPEFQLFEKWMGLAWSEETPLQPYPLTLTLFLRVLSGLGMPVLA